LRSLPVLRVTRVKMPAFSNRINVDLLQQSMCIAR
jgi:hypothetical protein